MSRILPYLFPLGAALLSLLSLGFYPAFNPDEMSIAIMADNFWKNGVIFYPLMEGVIHPDVAPLSGAMFDTLRGVHIGLVAVVGKLVGYDFVLLRAFSWMVWVATGLLLFFLVKTHLGNRTGWISLVLWSFSFDGVLASHLIRPDIFVPYLMVLSLWLINRKKSLSENWPWVLVGFLCGVAPGLHPHALVVPVLVFFQLFLMDRDRRTKMNLAGRVLLGGAAGAFLFFMAVDYSTYAISRHTFVSKLSLDFSHVWLERLNPFRLLSDVVFSYLNPTSYYLGLSPDAGGLMRMASGVFNLAGFVFPIVWVMHRPPKKPFLKRWVWSALLVWVVTSYGRIRPDMVYNVPSTLMMVPVAAWVLGEAWGPFLRNFKKGPVLGMGLMFVVISLAWVLRLSPIFLLCLLLFTLAVDKATERFVAVVGIAGFGAIFSLWIWGKSYMTAMREGLRSSISSPAGLFFLGAAVVVAGVVIFSMKTKKTRLNIFPLLKVSLLGLWFGFLALGVVYHQAAAIKKGQSLASTFEKAKRLINDTSVRVMGPKIFWVPYQNSFGDIHGLVFDYFYSGQLRAKEGIARFRPDILIINDEFRKRFMGRKKIDAFVPVRFKRLGSIPSTVHHSFLEIYRLDWP